LLSGGLSDKAAYDLHELARDYDRWPAETDQDRRTLARAIQADATHLLAHKEREEDDARVRELEGLIAVAANARELAETAKELLIARRIASAQRQASGGRS
jgi:hypothetical protein